ncbi:hypothetical protein [Pseudomonas brassicacearum]|uniref:hypothetical protein n=1 Tax=Pseudomonas brassicacearum TaxID=930166 RepID=UPI0016160B74|nr:hypothetical protein [Pseudomonas brassicacearum]
MKKDEKYLRGGLFPGEIRRKKKPRSVTGLRLLLFPDRDLGQKLGLFPMLHFGHLRPDGLDRLVAKVCMIGRLATLQPFIDRIRGSVLLAVRCSHCLSPFIEVHTGNNRLPENIDLPDHETSRSLKDRRLHKALGRRMELTVSKRKHSLSPQHRPV